MNDRELLELAAKAAALGTLVWGEAWNVGGELIDCTDIPYIRSVQPDESDVYWNPLDDDGDALRLAVKLHITIDRGEVEPAAWCYCDWQDTASEGFVEKHGNDPYAATRRAIVRAAAEIGRNMK